MAAILSPGSHTITASVSDSGSLPGSDAITVTVNPNQAPVVVITAPTDGSSFDEGTTVTFTGTATDAEDGTISGSLSWSSSLDGALGTGASVSTSTLSLGTHTVTASVTDSGGASGSNAISVTVNAVGGGCTDCIDWNVTGTVSYSNQDAAGNVTVEDGGDTLSLLDNTWRRTTQTFTITPNTVLEVEFSSAVQGEIHGIGFDENETLSDASRIFQLHGTQNWSGAFHDFDNYAGGGAFVTYQIPVGTFYTGSSMFLVLVNDFDAGSGNDSRFRNVRVFENTPPPGTCAADVDFSAGAAGWINNAASTCTTGDFVVGTPTEVVNSGVTTQLAGDDAGDFFLLEMSTDGGASWSSLASVGDVTSNAVWTEATATAAAGDNVQFRIQVSDGSGPGDLVEAGVDDVMICP